jgi:glycosyltransferase-like protein
VSRLWREFLAREYGREAVLVGNGVDATQFSPVPGAADAALRARLSLAPDAKVFLAIGGVEQRKNTIRLLAAYRVVQAQYPSSYLIIAGGASLLDHDAYLARFAAALETSGLPDGSVIRTGPLPQPLMSALYRSVTALVFPSIKEGFGLVVLEAMACGLPVVTSRIAPFTEYLGDGDVLWCDPRDAGSIAAAMVAALEAPIRRDLIVRGLAVAARHRWATTARAHLSAYKSLSEAVYA